jgi:hypothetical protein
VAAPKFQPLSAEDSAITSYQSPDHVPDAWTADRPGEIDGRQPQGAHFGYQGPDQGYALALAARLEPDLVLSAIERADDAIAGCVAIALRRASIYGRAPVIHDVRIALTIWGFLDPAPPAELVDLRVERFEGVGNPHHYDEVRSIADAVPESTLRSTPVQVSEAYPAQWRSLLGV